MPAFSPSRLRFSIPPIPGKASNVWDLTLPDWKLEEDLKEEAEEENIEVLLLSFWEEDIFWDEVIFWIEDIFWDEDTFWAEDIFWEEKDA